MPGLMHLGRAFANANRQHGAYARLRRALKNRFAVVRIAGAIEVRVRIDQQTGTSNEFDAVCRTRPNSKSQISSLL
jgi:hypothetical protein